MKVIAAVGALALSASLMLAGLSKAQEATTTDAPATGKNSFTASQAKAWFEEVGYTNVANLTLGSDGVWRANARLKDLPALIRLDYQGNVSKH